MKRKIEELLISLDSLDISTSCESMEIDCEAEASIKSESYLATLSKHANAYPSSYAANSYADAVEEQRKNKREAERSMRS